MANGSVTRITTGQSDFSGGVNSNAVPTAASAENPNGLKSNQLAWLHSGTVRNSGISPRGGYNRLMAFAAGIGLLQEASFYEPDQGFPYIIAQIGGRTLKMDVETLVITEITIPGDPNPAGRDQAWMCQGEQFLVIQDGVSVPLIWDGVFLRRAVTGEIPTAECMDYYMGRLWLAFGREYLAGDIVRGPSGTAVYDFRDSILKMTENTYLATGGTFIVPTMAGNIRALKHPANIDTALGEGQLLPFTRRNIYSTNVVPTRAAWATLSEPIQRVAQINFGTMSDRSVVAVNGDLFYRSPDGIRSFIQATRLFEGWGQLPVSIEEARAISRDDRSLLRFASGIEFDNRLLQTALPFQTDVGVAFKAILPLNFDLVSTLADKHPPAWEGAMQGLDFMRLLKADFGGRQRAFSFVREAAGNLALWEITNFEQEDTNISGESRISWGFETPGYTWGKSFELKELDTLEIWLDRLYGNVEFTVEFRPDQHPCWEPWTKWIECAPRNNCEDCGVLLPDACYPQQIYPMQYRATIVLPKPPTRCEKSQSRPLHIGYSFQFRVFIKGFVRVRGLMVHAFPKDKQPYLSVTEPCSSAGC